MRSASGGSGSGGSRGNGSGAELKIIRSGSYTISQSISIIISIQRHVIPKLCAGDETAPVVVVVVIELAIGMRYSNTYPPKKFFCLTIMWY